MSGEIGQLTFDLSEQCAEVGLIQLEGTRKHGTVCAQTAELIGADDLASAFDAE